MKDINFLKKETFIGGLSKKKESKNLIKNLLVISVVGVVAIYLSCVAYDIFLNLRISSMNKEINDYAEVEILKQQAVSYKTDIDTIKKIIDKNDSLGRMKSDTLKIIGDKCPSDVSINTFAIDAKYVISITGKGNSKEKILDFVENLKKSGYFKGIDLTSLVNGKTDINGAPNANSAYYNYTIKILN